MVIEILLISLICTFIFIGYLLILALKRINTYEEFIIQFQQVIEYATEQMKKVDADGHYESDDETAFFFKQLKDIQLLLNNIFEEKEAQSGQEEKE
tara:strand:+ start:2152 stop:2439 length:288 start_codon:yes stop_codon:yes gene_type:complete